MTDIKDCRLKLRDVRLVWDDIRPYVIEIRDQHNLGCKQEDVYAQCLYGNAFCYTCDDGFVIVKPQEDHHTLKKELFVWLCYSHGKDALIEYHDDICAIAKDIHAESIKFVSSRPGFQRLAKQNGWLAMTTYKMPVEDKTANIYAAANMRCHPITSAHIARVKTWYF